MGLVKDARSLSNLEQHIQKKKQWRNSLISKLSTLRTPPVEMIGNSPSIRVGTPKTKLQRQLENENRLEEAMSPKSKIPSTPKTSTRVHFNNNILLLDENFLKDDSPGSTKTPKNFKKVEPSTPKRKNVEVSASKNVNSKHRKKVKLLSEGFTFSNSRYSMNHNPLYEKHLEKLEKRLQQDGVITSKRPTLHSASGSRVAISGLIKSKVKPQSPQSRTKPMNMRDSRRWASPEYIKTEGDQSKESFSMTTMDSLAKMYKKLGLDRSHVEKDFTPINIESKSLHTMSNMRFETMVDSPRTLTAKERIIVKGSRRSLKEMIPEHIYYNRNTITESSDMCSARSTFPVKWWTNNPSLLEFQNN